MVPTPPERDMSQRHVPGQETAALDPVPPAALPRESLVLVVLGHPFPGTWVRLGKPLVVGRDPACDLALDDAAVSREHVRLAPCVAGIEVTDLGSRNGTFLDGRAITTAMAKAGSLLRVGDTLMRVCRFDEEWEPASLAGPLVGGTSLAPVRRLVTLVGPTDLPVLVLGETGTGKEVVARMLHAAGARQGPFVAVNCAALPESLVESELFGHAAGAFTGATRGRRGLFAAASGGTLFLDEVGDLPLAAQAKLLRVLEDGMVRPVGSEQAIHVSVRVISATNRDLGRDVAEGRFRADLLARLGAVEVRLPPLRDRIEDLPELAAFLRARSGRPGCQIEPNALEAMALYDWPHNVRELDNVLRSAALGTDSTLLFGHLPPRIREVLARARDAGAVAPSLSARIGAVPARASEAGHTRSRPRVSQAEPGRISRERLEEELRAQKGNVRRTAQALGLARSQTYRLLARWGLDPSGFRSPARDLLDHERR